MITWRAFVLTYVWIIVTANALKPLRNCRDPDFVILKRKDKPDFPHSEQQVALRAFGITPAEPQNPLFAGGALRWAGGSAFVNLTFCLRQRLVL